MNKIETNVIKPDTKFFENDLENSILDINFESILDSKIQSIEDYISSNDGKGKTEEEKDELYKTAQNLWRDYAIALRDTKYNFFLNRKQYKFLTDLILTKLEYDVNTVFFAIELTDLMGNMKSLSSYTNDKDLIAFPVNATEITYIYHLISTYKIKGLTKDAYFFSEVLKRIGDISKIFNYYDTSGKSLSTEIQNWVACFSEQVKMEEAIDATVVSPE